MRIVATITAALLFMFVLVSVPGFAQDDRPDRAQAQPKDKDKDKDKDKNGAKQNDNARRMKIGVTSRGRKGRIIMLVPRTGALKTRGQRTGRGTMLVRKSKPGLRSRLVRKNGAMTIWDVNKNNGAPRSAMKAANAQPKNIADSAFPTIDFTPALDESIVFMLTASRS